MTGFTGNQADYARHRGVSRKTVTKWRQRGLLRFSGDDVDFEASEQALRDHGLLDADTAGNLDGLWSKAEAERVKENYAALLKRVEYERRSAEVAEIDDVVVAVASEYALVRSRLSRIGEDLATRLAGMADASAIKALVDDEVVKALEELTVESEVAPTLEAAHAAVAERFGQ